MKAIVCELCGSNELIKDGDVYVCQHCGTKYTTEEARKLLIDAKVTIAEPVAVQGVASVDNLLRRAKDFESRGNLDKAVEYYNRILDIDFDNEEAKRGLARTESSMCSSKMQFKSPARRRVTGPNLIADFSGGKWGSVAAVFVDGKRVATVNGGKQEELTLSPGTHLVGVAGGLRKCKDPIQIDIDHYTAYHMAIEQKGLAFKCHITEA